MERTPRRVVERFYRGLADGEMDFDLVAEGIEWITPESLPWTVEGMANHEGTVAYRGLEQFGRYLQSLLGAVEDMRAETKEVIEATDGRVIVIGEEIGRSRNGGRAFRAPFAHVLTVVDGKITRLRGHVDSAILQDACRAP